MATSWVAELDKKEHKNWVMVGCALNITKNGITQLIQGTMEAWYQSLISSPPVQSLPACTCVLGSATCVRCVTWKMELKRHHKFNQPKISNSDRTQWGSVTGAWETAKVFMSALGSRKTQVVDAETTDIGGLLNLLEQCPFIQPPVNPTVLSSARDQCRNHWAHAPKQELQDADVNAIFVHLNNLLNDPAFIADSAAQRSSNDLQDLRNNGLVNVRDSEVEALNLLRQSLVTDLSKCRDDLAEFQNKVGQLDDKTKKVDTAVQKVREQGNLNREEITKQSQQLQTKIKEVEANLSEKISTILLATNQFNKQVDERDDLQGKLDLVSNDLEYVRNCVQSVDTELAATKSELANLEIKVSETISSLQMDVMVMKDEVETLKINASHEENGEDTDALSTAPSRLAAFTGREAALRWLEQNLTPGQRSENCPEMCCRTKAICGLGGCGKTSLAVEFSWRCKNRFPGGVFWINGESDENISKSVAENLALLNIPSSTSEKLDDTLNRFLVRLSKEKRPWLLVVDNADDLEDSTCPTGVKKICKGPWQRNGSTFKLGNILLTTRRSAKDTKTFLKLSSADDCFQLQCFNEKDGALFLMQKTGCKGEFLDPDAVLLAKDLGSLPLALEQAAAYISALPIPCSFEAYLKKYQDAKLRLLEQQPVSALSVEAQHRLSVHTTWQMNFEFVKTKSPAAAIMMRIAAFLESDNVPIDVINPGFPELDQEELRKSGRSEIDVDSILKVLSSYSLLSVDQKRRVFAIHKLVQEVVKESLTTEARIGALKAASRVLHFAFKANNEQNIFIGLLLSFRTLKNHMEEESKLLKEDSLHTLYNTEILELCYLVFNLFTNDISLFGISAELLEFKQRVLGVVYSEADQPYLFLWSMVERSTSKLARSAPLIDKEAKELSDNAVKKLTELEESGVEVNVDVKFDVLYHSASFHALENQWEDNYKALLELEELPISVNKFVELQQDIAKVEGYLSSCNTQPALRRYQNTLKIARETYPSNGYRIVGLLQEISDFLFRADKVEEAKPYADELWEICKKESPTSDRYIFGVSTAMKIKCYFDPQASENTLVDILKRNWPHIYRIAASASQREISEEEITVDDGTEKILSVFLNRMLACIFAIYARKAGEENFATSKFKFYRAIADIKLRIDKSLFGEIHPAMKEAYKCQQRVQLIQGNITEALRFQELVDKCQQQEPDQNKSVNQTLPFNDNLIHTSMCKNSANVLFEKGNYSGALELYNQALSLTPNDAKLLTNKAMTCVKLSEQSSVELDKHKFLEQALQVSQNAINADPSWVKGYFWKAVSLAHLGKRGPSLAAAAVAKHLFPAKCAKIPAVVERYGSFDVQLVTTGLELFDATGRRGTQNLVIVVKEGKYELPSPLNIPKNAVVVGLGEVRISFSKGIPLQLEETAYMENILVYPSLEILKERAKKCVIDGQADEALSLYSQALFSRPNNPQILTSRALCYLKSAELKNENPSERKSVLELGLKDAEAAIKADPAWLLGYHTKAAILAELDRKQQALAAASVFKHLSLGRDVPAVTERYGNLQVLVVQSSVELCSVTDRIKKLEGVNQVVLIKEGEYLLERSIEIPQPIIVVSQGKVKVSCKIGAPFCFSQAGYVENVKIVDECENQQEAEDGISNDTQSEVVSLATPSGYEHNKNECKVD